MSDPVVYRTQAGMIFRIVHGYEGHMRVETLEDTGWVSGSIGMMGLRVAPTTVKLTARQVLRLPF